MQTKNLISGLLVVFLIFALTATVSATTIFSDDMESGINSWTSTGFWHQKSYPSGTCIISDINPILVSLPDDGCLPTAYSGVTVWWYGEDVTGTFIGSDYNDTTQTTQNGGTSTNPNNGSLISPTIDLTGASAATLYFLSWYEIEGVDVHAYDMMRVYVSTDGGTGWTLLGSINPINDVNGESFRPYSSGGLGQVGVWTTQQFDLSNYIGYSVMVKFEFRTEDHLYNGFRGWLIDDVSVTTEGAASPTIENVTPSAGIVGTIIYIDGTNFLNGATVSVGGYSSSTVSVFSSTMIHATVPTGLTAGTYDVTVTNPDSQSATLTDGFTVTSTHPPAITSITPDYGATSQTTDVVISGSHFESGATVQIASTSLTGVTVIDSSTITATVPSGLPTGYQNVKVTNPDSQYDLLVGGFYVHSPGVGTVFVTSTYYYGSIGGLSGADDECQTRAGVAGFSGTWKALLSTSSTDARDRISDTTYRRLDGAIVATSKSNLFDGYIDNEINLSELFAWVYADTVWTGSGTAGTSSGYTCSDWTTSSSSYIGTMGHTHSSNSWIAYSHSALCSNHARLYCFMSEATTTTTTTTTTLEVTTTTAATTTTTLAGPRVEVSPASQTANVGNTFTVCVNVAEMTDLYAAEFDLSFDPTLVQCDSFAEGSFLGSTIGFDPTIDNTAGTITGYSKSKTGPSGTSGAGTIAAFQFTALAAGTSALTLSEVRMVDSATTEITTSSVDGSVTVSSCGTADINCDGSVNIFDLALLGQAWGSSSGDSNWNADADLNSDATIDIFDLALLGQNWGNTY